ncbi:MAG TPA: rhodanese-like domain-containing protein [Hyphomicrobiaceae bacterium]|nr:rhodanese-like domain-containing protein [Hyphomicrobiaceae bacterium]
MEFINDLFRGGFSGKLPYVVLLILLVVVAWRMFGPASVAAGEVMSPADAYEKSSKGEIVLVDVRTPKEWQQTGLPASGYAITMHQQGPEFLSQLDAALGGDRSKPLAIICRTGNRTGSLVGPLEKAGYTRVINVAEGMAGGRYGPGWIKAGLPLRTFVPGQSAPKKTVKQR